jgi:hypothetical protein
MAFRVQFLPKPSPGFEANDSLLGASIGAEEDEDVPF